MTGPAATDRELRALRRGLEALALRASRALSARAQSRLDLALEGIETVTACELADRLGPRDVGVSVDLGGGAPPALVLPSRGLAFALLALRFGARGVGAYAAPDRAYTRIEERSLERMAAEIWAALRIEAPELCEASGRVGGLVDAERLRDSGSARFGLGRFDVRGLPTGEWLAVVLPLQIRNVTADGQRSADAA